METLFIIQTINYDIKYKKISKNDKQNQQKMSTQCQRCCVTMR